MILDVTRRPGFTTKCNTKNRLIEIKAERFEQWKKWLGVTWPAVGRVIAPGTRDAVFTSANAWIKGQIPNRQKGLHELRKQAISDHYTQTKSLISTATFAGDSIKTITAHYVTDLEGQIAL